jgi:hypothetical protein
MSSNKVIAVCAISATALAAHAGVPISWDSAVDGNWNTPTNWNPAVVPLPVNTAELGLAGAYTVNYDTSSSIAGLNITNPDVQLDIAGSRSLTMLGNINNEGTIVVNPNQLNTLTRVNFDLSASLNGSGSLVLGNTTSRAALRTQNGAVLTQGASHTIEGRGQIEAEMINNGTIDANFSGGEMLVISLDKTNNAIMRATSGGIMDISGITLTQSASGDLLADGAGSQVEITGSTIINGDVMSSNGGVIEILGSSLFDGVRASGDVSIPGTGTLEVMNSLENNALITVNTNGINTLTTLRFLDSSSLDGNGTLELVNTTTRSRVQTEPGMTFTNGGSHTIEGRGQIEASMINNGTINANVDNGEMLIISEPKTNNALMQATNGGILDVNGTTITQSASGDLLADGVDSQVEITGATVINGDVMSSNGGEIEILGTSSMDNVRFSGVMSIPGTGNLRITNSLENNGVITLNTNVINTLTTIQFLDSSAFNGSGSLVMNNTTTRARIIADPGIQITNAATHTIQGRGQIEADLLNNGLVSADVPSNDLRLITEDKSNNATMQAVNGAIMDVSGITISQSASGQLLADGAGSEIELTNATVDGGALIAQNDGVIEISGTSHVQNVDISGALIIPGASNLGVGAGTLNNGTITVNSTGINAATALIFDEETTIGGTGTIILNSTTTRARLTPGVDVTQGALGSGQRLEGVGQIEIDLTNHGTISPGLSVGTMTATNPVSLSSSSVYEAEVNSTGADLLDSTSTIELSGELDVSFIDGFTPAGFWSRTILEGSAISGQFDSVSEPTPVPGLKFRYYNTGTEIRIGASCKGDIDLNNTLDVFDVFAFLDQFAAEDPLADLQPDGIFDIFDVFAFLADFNSGGCG